MKQCALIIGNNAYPDAVLKNAVNDANDIAAKLTELGCVCIVATDASHKQMDQHLLAFVAQLAVSEVGVFFFAGHGMQIDGVNYLVPV